ncbi:FAD-dependent thymidylate synthase [Candidatus Odyssella acanthamoebae]|uniref:Flavin-dependent thymidylate synthase n=1 Tax=Candidatus Odyssella acanthamoebae TaxID=91604 RepID=A0A077AWW5_9PROT|nr:FAD-dependent thymidylate synthase [Candidatus Paracaedibacter acanthamoebae]AIK97021.1 FAD-dependent thymidylate synthase [Candidatus Paracaedibacter acanthamoebae]
MVLNALQEQEILNQQKETFQTRRATVPALEEILFDAIPLLDHGFIRVVDYMGDDSAVVQAARVSYGKGTKKVSEDQGLINYLMRHRHSTPFEMCEIKFHVKLPIFVARQWIRHRTANVNEYSARYSIMDKEFYIPRSEHMAAQSKINHQGRGEVLEEARAEKIMQLLKDDALRAYDHYQLMLNETETGDKIDDNEDGLARELARMNLPVNFYTQWYWKIDLHNFMHFLSLRADPHAQYEIRVYAEAMLDVMKKWVPATYQAFMDYRMGAAYLSSKGLSVIQALLAGRNLTREESGMSLREWRELESVLQIKLP